MVSRFRSSIFSAVDFFGSVLECGNGQIFQMKPPLRRRETHSSSPRNDPAMDPSESEKPKDGGDGNVRRYSFTTPVGGIRITSSRPSLPALSPSCVDDESVENPIEAAPPGASGARLRMEKQLRVCLPRTPSSPCPSPFSGPWHRSGDSNSSSSKSSTPSPASTKSSPATPPGVGADEAFGDTQSPAPGPTSRLSGSLSKDADFARLMRRHSFPPKASVLQDELKAAADKKSPTIEIPQIKADEPSDIPSTLEEAVTSQQPDIVAYYLRQGSRPDGNPSSKVSPLILASSIGNEKIVRMLLAAGADINFEDKSKGTAIHHAAAGGHRGVIKLLVVAGADMFHKTEEGHLAVQLTHDSRIRHLLTCRMRSSSESNIAQKLGGSEIETPKLNLLDHLDGVTSSSTTTTTTCRSPTGRCSKIVQNPVLVPPLPCNENGFTETTMQKVSPRSESPKNIQRVLEQKKEKLRRADQVDQEVKADRVDQAVKDDRVEQERPASTRAECSSIQGECSSEGVSSGGGGGGGGSGGGRPRRKSVQFIDRGMGILPETTKNQCAKCKRDDCDGKCQDQSLLAAAAAATAVVAADTPVAAAAADQASSSRGVKEKLFPQPDPKTTGRFKWTKGELLGEGAYGKVFSGLNQSTGELMAVKQLKIDPGEGQEKAFYLAALEREIDLYKKLRHKHIVGYINMEQDAENGNLYIFLEYVSGGSIQSMLERFGPFSESLVRVYTRQLLLGLQYLHENQIVHRDIKGGNVLVDAVGTVKLADFGASKAFHDPTVTNECKSIRGSVFWMAPEVIKGDGYGRRADIWSVGCTVIEMLTAMHPWPDIDNTWSAIFHIAKASSGPPVPEHGSDCVKDFIQNCFQMDPRSRPTAAQLLEHRFVSIDSD